MPTSDDLEAVRASLKELCEELLRADAQDESMRSLVHEAQAKLEPAPFYVVACGEYGRGKSTLLSALAGRRQLFPHEPTDTTSIATTLAWGRTEEAVVKLGDASRREVTVPIGGVRQYVTQLAERDDEQVVLVVEMRAPLDPLRSGLVLVDTPGVNSRNEAHNVATRKYLEEADAILFVTSTDEPLSVLELGVLRQAAEQCPQVVAVLTKADLGGAAALAASASERVSQALGRPVDVLPVSAVKALDAIEDHIPSLLGDSEIPTLARRIAALRSAHGAQMALSAEPPMSRAITLLAQPYVRELAMLREAADQADAVDRELARVRKDIAALDRDAARFRDRLPGKVNDGLASIRTEVSSKCGDLATRIRADQKITVTSMSPNAYLRDILDTLADIASHADVRRHALITRIAGESRRLTKAELAPSAEADSLRSALPQPDAALEFGPQPGFSIAAVTQGVSSGVKLAGIAGSVGSVIGGTVASVPGAAAGALIGGLLGHMVGWVGGTREAIRQAQQDWRTKNMHSIAEIAGEWVVQAERDMDGWIRDATSVIIADLRAGFDAAVEERRDRLKSFLHSAEDGRTDSAASRAARIDATAEQIVRYERLSHELTDGVDRLKQLSRPA